MTRDATQLFCPTAAAATLDFTSFYSAAAAFLVKTSAINMLKSAEEGEKAGWTYNTISTFYINEPLMRVAPPAL